MTENTLRVHNSFISPHYEILRPSGRLLNGDRILRRHSSHGIEDVTKFEKHALDALAETNPL